jgi:hypothetical protein
MDIVSHIINDLGTDDEEHVDAGQMLPWITDNHASLSYRSRLAQWGVLNVLVRKQ